eukprot:6754109-Alexandrium_andersonii.AAC.1
MSTGPTASGRAWRGDRRFPSRAVLRAAVGVVQCSHRELRVAPGGLPMRMPRRSQRARGRRRTPGTPSEGTSVGRESVHPEETAEDE